MEANMFNELLESVQEAKSIMDGKTQPSRKFLFEEPNPKEIRVKLKLTQDQLVSRSAKNGQIFSSINSYFRHLKNFLCLNLYFV